MSPTADESASAGESLLQATSKSARHRLIPEFRIMMDLLVTLLRNLDAS